MIVLGLTGSIAMGKSTAANMFQRLGVPVHDADRTVHALFDVGGAAVSVIDRAFPGVADAGAVDRDELGRRVFADPAALRRLESLLHPLVYADQHRFLAIHARRRTRLVVLDVPLLFETGGDRVCDGVCVVSASRYIQVQRLLRRPGMTRDRVQAILARQMPDAAKRKRADFLIPSGLGFAEMMRTIQGIIASVSAWTASAWPSQRHSRSI